MTQEQRIARRRADTPRRYQQLYDRCTSGTASPREAIKMQCLECWCWVQHETQTCDNYACPLWQYRPYQVSPGRPLDDFAEIEATNKGKLMHDSTDN